MTRYAVIMAGGTGERFWPVSRKDRPKQLLRLTHPEETLLEEAVNRIAPLIPVDHVILATGRSLQQPVRDADLVPDDNVIAEPNKRNTLGCLAWIAASLMAKHPGEEASVSMAVLTADHKIEEPQLFRHTVDRALTTAEKTHGLVTIGIKPTRPETGYGYVELGQMIEAGSPAAFRAESFREKPDFDTAQHYVEAGNYVWNSGMFFWTLRGFLGEMSRANPEVYQTILSMAKLLQEGNGAAAEQAFDTLPSESIDYALLEKASQVYSLAGEFPWDDVGAWDALERSMPLDERANVVQGSAMVVDTSGSIVYNDCDGVLVTTVGIHDLIVVVTGNAVMICNKSEAQRVKEILQKLPADSHLR